MKKLKMLLLGCMIFIGIPNVVSAQSVENISQENVISETEKYYKTVVIDNLSDNRNYTVEVTKDEYENNNDSEIIPYGSGNIETTYKKMTTTISESNSGFKYQVKLTWKNFPKVRSFDIIAIGFNPSVKPSSGIYFTQNYCYTDGECNTSQTHTPQIFERGAGTSFKLPSGDLSSLSSTMYFYVEKNVDATILRQSAYGDYSHATTSVSFEESKKYIVSVSGIGLDSSLINSFDEISCAEATWSGSW